MLGKSCSVQLQPIAVCVVLFLSNVHCSSLPMLKQFDGARVYVCVCVGVCATFPLGTWQSKLQPLTRNSLTGLGGMMLPTTMGNRAWTCEVVLGRHMYRQRTPSWFIHCLRLVCVCFMAEASAQRLLFETTHGGH